MRILGPSRGLFAVLALIGGIVGTSPCRAVPGAAPLSASPVVQADWQGPLALPPRFRNHCAIDVASGRPYCSDHCGFEYQFYYCTQRSFGCCRIGFGYCDWRGQLRCNP
jgi:hypothetical protein